MATGKDSWRVEERKCYFCLQEWPSETSRVLQAEQLHHNLWEDKGATNPRSHFSKQVKHNMIVRNSQHGFTKRKPCLTNLITFHNVDDVTVLMDDGGTVEIVYLNFSKTCDTGSPNRLTEQLAKHRLNKHTMRWIKTAYLPGSGCCDHWFRGKSSVVYPRGQCWDQHC